MNRQHIAELGLKLIGIYSFVQAIPLVGGFINVLGMTFDEQHSMRFALILSSAITFFLLLGIGLFLITFSKKIAIRFFPEDSQQVISSDISLRDVQSIAFSIGSRA